MLNNLKKISFNRPDKSHKGTFGSTLIIGGNSGTADNFFMLGAPALASIAAQRTGVGKVFVASEIELLPHILTLCPTAIGVKYKSTLKAIKQVQCVVIGCGWGVSKHNQKLLLQILTECKKDKIPIVIDADGLNNICKNQKLLEFKYDSNVFFTPHSGELGRLTKVFSQTSDEQMNAQALSKRTGATIIHKDYITNIYTPEGKHFLFEKPNSKLSIPGSGDVLAGILGGLVSLNNSLHCKFTNLELAVEAVLKHSNAGKQLENGDTAMELAKLVS